MPANGWNPASEAGARRVTTGRSGNSTPSRMCDTTASSSRTTGTRNCSLMLNAATVTSKTSCTEDAVSTTAARSPWLPQRACITSPCDGSVGRPVLGPIRWESTTTHGVSVMAA